SQTKIDKLSPYSHYAAAVKCSPQSVAGWNCGANCVANPTFQLLMNGGDGSEVQFWFVGYHQYLDTIIVAHQGIDQKTSRILLYRFESALDESRRVPFPSISTTIQVHKGFAEEQSNAILTAAEVLEAVNILIGEHPSATVATVGIPSAQHSLWSMVSISDCSWSWTPVSESESSGMANEDFANYVDYIFQGCGAHQQHERPGADRAGHVSRVPPLSGRDPHPSERRMDRLRRPGQPGPPLHRWHCQQHL
ncbi:hypothetical protein BJV77DRAFT_1118723, partial [Russula vinacea]